MIRLLFALSLAAAATGCGRSASATFTAVGAPAKTVTPVATDGKSLVEARKGFVSKLQKQGGDRDPVPNPPPAIFTKVKYESEVGPLAAFLTPDPKDGKKHPAIIWITGGDCNSIDEVWKPQPAANDQTAAAYRKAGIRMMFPSLRGGNDNPGQKQGFLGEVDDVLAAATYLSKQPGIDPDRIYLGGHSTGGTLVLLAAECSTGFRAVFSFGPADDVAGYGPEYLPFDASNPKEIELRSPGKWLASVKVPTFVIEGTKQGNVDALRSMQAASTNPNLKFFAVGGRDHFNVLAPANAVLAAKILADTGATCNITLTAEELKGR